MTAEIFSHKYTALELQAISTAITMIWFEVLKGGYKIKKLLYRSTAYKYRKPWDCRFCTHFWIGSMLSIYFIFTNNNSSLVIFLALNLITSKLYDSIYKNQ